MTGNMFLFNYSYPATEGPYNTVGGYTWTLAVYSDESCQQLIAQVVREGNWMNMGESDVVPVRGVVLCITINVLSNVCIYVCVLVCT